MAGDVRIGISGWTYEGWRGSFYPEGLPQKKELHFASRQLNSIEINGTFYSLQSPSSYQHWYDETPKGFIFSVKGPRFITHIKRLKDVQYPLANFLASGIFHLKEKLGPILWQLPPSFTYNRDRLEGFFAMLPRDTQEASQIAQMADDHLKFPPHTEIDKKRKLRHAIEVRHASFCNPEFIDALKAYDIALVFAQGKPEWPYMEDVTSDFIYARLHGDEEVYVSGYSEKDLDHWAARLKLWRVGKQPKDAVLTGKRTRGAKSRDIYVYFDNDVKVRAPYDAASLFKRFKPSSRTRISN